MQPVRDSSGITIGYELFYRDSDTATSAAERGTAATLHVLAGLSTLRARRDQARGEFLYFVNVTRDVVVGNVAIPDPSEVAVLEIQPDVAADDAVVEGAEQLRILGYGIALDRFTPHGHNGHDRLLHLASHVKLDIDGGDPQILRAAASRVRDSSNALLIGCRIGSLAAHDLAREIGCDLFQGHTLDAADRHMQESIRGSLTAYLRLLQLLATDDLQVDITKVSEAVMRDADLSLRVLYACNAAAAGLTRKITSIKDAVIGLGMQRLRHIVNLAIAQGLTVRGEDQLLTLIEYATLAELVGVELGVNAGTGFLAGLLLETADVLNAPVHALLDGLPLDDQLAADLRHHTGAVGRTLNVIELYKRGDRTRVEELIEDIAVLHTRAMLIAAGLLQLTGDPGPAQTSFLALPPVRILEPAGASPAPVDDLATLLGPPPTADEAARAEQWHSWALDRSRRDFLRGSLPLQDLELQHIGPEQLATMMDRKALSHCEIDGIVYVPMWQFTVDGRLLPGVDDIVATFPGDAIALCEWVTRPCPGLNRAIPIALLLQGQTEQVAAHAKGIGSW